MFPPFDSVEAMIDLGPAADRLAAVVREVRDEQLSAPTPCPDYALGDLLDHVGGLALAFAAAAEKSTDGVNASAPPPGDASKLGDDWRTRISDDLTAMAAAWRDPDAWDGMTRIAGGEAPGGVVGNVAVNELVAHGWDVARASGQQFDADQASLDASFEFISSISAPEMAEHRGPAFGPVVDVAGERSRLDQLMALNGRDPDWS